jgi:hypothetical protein
MIKSFDNKIIDWNDLAKKSRVYLHKKMCNENTYFTPIGILSVEAVNYLVEKKLIEPYPEDDRFFVWSDQGSSQKWEEAKVLVYKRIMESPTSPFKKIIKFCDNHDYLSLMRTHSLPVDRETSRQSIESIRMACEQVVLDEEALVIAEIYKRAEEANDNIAKGKYDNTKVVEEVFDIV